MRATKCGTGGVVAVVGFALLAAFLAGCAETGNEIATPAVKAKSEYVDEYCTILGGPIDPATVKPELTRWYKGKLVAFCCPGCPEQWDKLTEQEKDDKLLKASIEEKHARSVHRWRWQGSGKLRRRVRY